MWVLGMLPCTDRMHTFGFKQSKSPLFSPYHFLLFFPFLHSLLPALIGSAFHLGRGLWVQRESRGKEQEGLQQGGTRRGGGQNRLIWDDMPHVHTQGPLFSRGPCDQPQERVAFFLSCSSFHPPPVFLRRADRRPPRGPIALGGSVDFPWQAVCSDEQRPASVCMHVLAKYESPRSQTPVKNREVWGKGKGACTSGPHDETMRLRPRH